LKVSYKFKTRAIELNKLYIKATNEYYDQLDGEYKIYIEEFPEKLNSSMLRVCRSGMGIHLKKKSPDTFQAGLQFQTGNGCLFCVAFDFGNFLANASGGYFDLL
jgi:hypothetical protein